MRFLQVLKLPHITVGIAVQGGLTVKFVDRHLIVFTVEGVLTVGHTVWVRCQHPAVAAGNDLVRVKGNDEVFAAPLQLAQAGAQFGDDGTPFAGRDDILVTSARLQSHSAHSFVEQIVIAHNRIA